MVKINVDSNVYATNRREDPLRQLLAGLGPRSVLEYPRDPRAVNRAVILDQLQRELEAPTGAHVDE